MSGPSTVRVDPAAAVVVGAATPVVVGAIPAVVGAADDDVDDGSGDPEPAGDDAAVVAGAGPGPTLRATDDDRVWKLATRASPPQVARITGIARRIRGLL